MIKPPLSLTAFLALSAATTFTGCTTPAYYNIPAQSADLAFHSPNSRNIRSINVSALRAITGAGIGSESGLGINQSRPLPYEFILPEGTSPETYAAVAQQLGEDALIPGLEPVPSTLTYEVREIRVRGDAAEADVVRETDTGNWELVEVSLDWVPLSGWVARYTRPRRIQVDAPRRPDLQLLPEMMPENAASPDALQTQPAGTQPAATQTDNPL